MARIGLQNKDINEKLEIIQNGWKTADLAVVDVPVCGLVDDYFLGFYKRRDNNK